MKAVELIVPPDKSISHRAIMLASISGGTTQIKNLLMAEDIKRTIEAFRAMGVTIRHRVSPKATHGVGWVAIIHGVGMCGLKKPDKPLYLGNSGTTMRLLSGILAGQDFEAVLTGDESLSKRPMKRIVEPLRKMGIEVSEKCEVKSVKCKAGKDTKKEIYPPLKIRGGELRAIKHKSEVASAQVKSCVLLAGLYADGVTSVTEPAKSRDHTERMLRMFGCPCTSRGGLNLPYWCRIKGPAKLKSPGIIEIPGDISSAAFFIVAGCILPGTKIIIKNVGLNPTRTGVLDILRKMGACIKVRKSEGHKVTSFEPVGDIIVKYSKLNGISVSPNEVVRAIDEIPIIMVAACFAKGRTVIRGIQELHVKETDRIMSMTNNLSKLGADIRHRVSPKATHGVGQVKGGEVVINGGRGLHGARVSSYGDHRTAMSMLIAGLRTEGKVTVTGLGCINKSFPNFKDLLNNLTL